MAHETERKFLVNRNKLSAYLSQHPAVQQQHIVQSYIAKSANWHVRVRVIDGKMAETAIKSASAALTRDEFNQSMDVKDAKHILSSCTDVIEKTRSIIMYEDRAFEVDDFISHDLLLCEIEHEEGESFALPPFLGKEVTGDPAYYNANL